MDAGGTWQWQCHVRGHVCSLWCRQKESKICFVRAEGASTRRRAQARAGTHVGLGGSRRWRGNCGDLGKACQVTCHVSGPWLRERERPGEVHERSLGAACVPTSELQCGLWLEQR
jgi:hypothetical protein